MSSVSKALLVGFRFSCGHDIARCLQTPDHKVILSTESKDLAGAT